MRAGKSCNGMEAEVRVRKSWWVQESCLLWVSDQRSAVAWEWQEENGWEQTHLQILGSCTLPARPTKALPSFKDRRKESRVNNRDIRLNGWGPIAVGPGVIPYVCGRRQGRAWWQSYVWEGRLGWGKEITGMREPMSGGLPWLPGKTVERHGPHTFGKNSQSGAWGSLWKSQSCA